MVDTKTTEKIAVPITNFYVPDSVKAQLESFASANNLGDLGGKLASQLESTGKAEIPGNYAGQEKIDKLAPQLNSIASQVKPFYEGIVGEIANLKSQEPTMNLAGYKKYLALLEAADKGSPEAPGIIQQKANEFKSEVVKRLSQVSPQDVVGFSQPPGAGTGSKDTWTKDMYQRLSDYKNSIPDIAERATQRFIIDRKTGEQSLSDWLASQVSIPGGTLRKYVQDLSSNLGEYIPSSIGPGAQQGEITRINTKIAELTKSQQEADRVAAQEALATQQRQSAADLFNQAIGSLNTPLPTFTPEFSAEALANQQRGILTQGARALADTEAGAQMRGITGSSIEQFGLATTQNQIAKTLADATFQFLLNSGQASQQNRQLLVNTLVGQSQSLLGAGQQTGGLAQQSALTGQQLDLQRQQLAEQIKQYNTTFSESQRQFNEQMQFQQTKAVQDLQLLMQQLSQGRNKNYFSSILGGAGLGAAAGYGIGALIGGPTAPILAPLIGGALGSGGAGLGEAFGS